MQEELEEEIENLVRLVMYQICEEEEVDYHSLSRAEYIDVYTQAHERIVNILRSSLHKKRNRTVSINIPLLIGDKKLVPIA